MQEIEFLEQNKTSNKNEDSFINKNLIFWKLIFSLSFILIGMILLVDSPAHLYGIYIGLFSSWVSLLMYHWSEKFVDKIVTPKSRVIYSWFMFIVIRWIVFLVAILLVIFLVNKPNLDGDRLKLLIEPINVFLIALAYQSLTLAIIFTPLTKIY